MTELNTQMLTGIRRASRTMVRKFGFMNRTLAGTNYSPSAVHAIIDIGTNVDFTAKKLSENLFLEKSSVSRLLRKLITAGEVVELPSDQDARVKYLTLTIRGECTLSNIDAFGVRQVSDAIAPLDVEERKAVLKGLTLYSNALNPENQIDDIGAITIHEGYRTELIGRISSLHAKIHGGISGLGMYFEGLVATGMTEFMPRSDFAQNRTWRAEQEGNIIGGITIDGEGLGNNIAHLRWFVIDNSAQGSGLGGKLLKKAMDFCDQQGFDEVHLWTYKGLDAAKRLYERHGFKLVEEKLDDQYGKELMEQKYIRKI